MTHSGVRSSEVGGGELRIPETVKERAELAGERVEFARRLRAEGDRTGAVDTIVASLRAGLWRYARLWSELVSLMESPADYALIRSLWLDSSAGCQGTVSIIRSVARAASAAGEHTDARALLRKALVLQARRSRGIRSRLGRLKRAVLARLPVKASAAAPFEHRAAEALLDLNRQVGDIGVRAFLISGTLLGYLREGRFISWDKDIDLGIFTSEVSGPHLEKVFDKSPVFDVRRLDFNTDRLRVNHANGVMIDIFPHYQDEQGRVWHDGTATRWWNTPFDLATVEFLGMPQLVPDPPEKYLDENYGDWRAPEPMFDARLDTPNVEVTDREYFDTLLYFSLLDAVSKNNRGKRQRYAELLRGLGEGEWLTRLGAGRDERPAGVPRPRPGRAAAGSADGADDLLHVRGRE
jgi:hypothetical protein